MRGALLLLLTLAAPATAAERRLFVSSFDRIRVEGPFPVTISTGRSTGGSVTGDARALEQVEVRQDGTTLVVRPSLDRGRASAQRTAGPVTIALTTTRLTSATLLGGGTLVVTGAVTGSVAGGRAERLDLSVTGAGSIALSGANVDAANATVIGTGQITLAGRAAKVRLLVNGSGKIAADKLDAGELSVRVDGPGEVAARARYTAAVTNAGLGKVAIAGSAKCVIKNGAGGPVTCGADSSTQRD